MRFFNFGCLAALTLSIGAMACHGSATNMSDDTLTIGAEEESVQPMWQLTEDDYLWADSVIATLTAKERVAQLFVPRLDITNNPSGIEQVRRVIEKEKMGGMLLGKGTIESYADLNNKAQQMSTVPLMITLDGEWGLAMRVPGTPRFPHNVALGAANDETLMYRYGKEMARQCRLMGIQVNFAPVMDVNSNPANPVIGFRSLGEDPQVVGRLAIAYSRGLSDGGVLAVGKHFPGHGDTSVDSHKSLPTVAHSRERLDSVDIAPFAMAINQGLPAVMVGHLNVPALDASGTPSSLSYRITTGILQDSLGFGGLIFTDALAMKGAVSGGDNNCVRAFAAGADLLLGSGAPVADLQAMLASIAAGKIKQSEVDRRCRKVLAYKHSLGLDRKPNVNTASSLKEQLASKESERIIEEMCSKAITLLRDKNEMIPLRDVDSMVVVSMGLPKENEVTRAIGAKKSFSIDKSTPLSASMLSSISTANKVLVLIGSDAAWAKSAFKRIVNECDDCGAVFLCNPYKAMKFDGMEKAGMLMMAYDDIPQMRVAVANALLGKTPITGKMPVNLGAVAKLGDGMMKR